jgi:hypothetical protein
MTTPWQKAKEAAALAFFNAKSGMEWSALPREYGEYRRGIEAALSTLPP